MFIKFIFFAFVLFTLSLWGLLSNRSNFIVLLLTLELLLLSISFAFLVYSCIVEDTTYFLLALLSLTVAACETVIGLSLLNNLYKTNTSSEIFFIENLKA